VSAPKGRRFELGLAADLDGDDKSDVVVWTVPVRSDDPTLGRGELWYYPAGQRPARLVTAVPGFVPAGPTCRLQADLTQTGKRTVTLVTRAECEAALVPRAPVQGVQVLAPARDQAQVLGFRIAAPAPAEMLKISTDTRDRDHDGRDDVELRVIGGVADAKNPPAAYFVWLDRAAGPSQMDDEPSRSLAKLASIEQVRASGKTTSLKVPDAVGNVRRLVASLCSESATARVWDWEGAALGCGDLALMTDRLAHAEVKSALTRAQPLEAFAALERDGWYGRPMSDDKRRALEELALAATRRVSVTRRVTLSVQPMRPPPGPRFSPLAFADDGGLLVQDESRVVHTIDASGTETVKETQDARPDADAAAPARRPWRLQPQTPAQKSLGPVVYACDRSEVLMTVNVPDSPVPELVPTRLLSPRPGACSTESGFVPPVVQAVGWPAGGVVSLVAGAVIGPGSLEEAHRAPALGAPLSPDGKWLVVPSRSGLLVAATDKGQVELWSSSLLKDASSLTDCVVSNGPSRVACLQARQAVLLLPEGR
jgi:hypothetical protein